MLKILAGFLSGVPIGMIIMSVLTMGKTTDLYTENEILWRENESLGRDLKIKRNLPVYCERCKKERNWMNGVREGTK